MTNDVWKLNCRMAGIPTLSPSLALPVSPAGSSAFAGASALVFLFIGLCFMAISLAMGFSLFFFRGFVCPRLSVNNGQPRTGE